jgi:hypothetical protein
MNRIRFAILPALLAVGVVRAAPVPDGPRPGAAIPGGVADAEGKTCYLAHPGGGAVDAVDAATGQTRWRSTAAERPLYVAGSLLFALAPDRHEENVARVVLLDARTGKEMLRSKPIVFPEGFRVAPERGTAPEAPASFQDYARSFDCVAVAADPEHLYIRWRFEVWNYSGGLRPRQPPRSGSVAREGVVRVDRHNGAVMRLPAREMPGPVAPPFVREAADGPVTIVGNRAYAVGKAGDAIVLRRWEAATGKALDPIPLREGLRLQGQIESTGLVVVTNRFSPNVEPEDRFCWVYRLDGRLTGRLPLPAEANAVRVVGPRAYFVVDEPAPGEGNPASGNRLVVFDLATGKKLWTAAVEAERLEPLFSEDGPPRR